MDLNQAATQAAATQTPQPILTTSPVRSNKVAALPQASLAKLSTVSLVLAAFFAVTAIFAAIAGFTGGNWSFDVPFISQFTLVTLPDALVAGLVATIFAVISFVTVRKITDAKALTSTCQTWSLVCGVISVIFAGVTVAIILYSLMMLGSKSVDQGSVWLDGFLPSLIVTGVTVGLTLILRAVANGKAVILGMFSTIVLAVAGLAFVLSIVSVLVSTYANSPANTYDDLYNDYKNYLNY